ncbi:MAG: aliphatic sulfonate ABC transporter substrate-binding protein [Caulobacteraceae bacterium]|nr:aliphatic sulfonate ABC transporter substrate-binding protein [Caulobacteraceae bacterium]
MISSEPIAAGIDRRVLAAAAGASLLAACAPRARSKAGLARVRIGYQKNGVLLLAKSRGAAAAALNPIALEWVEFPSGPPLLEAMNAGAVDLGAVGDTPPIFAQAAGAQLAYVAVQPLSGLSEAIVVPSGSPVRGVRDLRGRRLGFTKASSSHLLAASALADAGLSLADVQTVFLSPSEAAAAFGRRAIDAWGIWDPFLALAERDQGARVIVTGAKVPRTDAFYLASRRFIDGSPEILRRLLGALARDAVWGQANPDGVVRIISTATGLPPDIVRTSLRRGPLAVDPITPTALARQQTAADTLARIGVVPTKVEVAQAAWTGWRPQS